VIGRDPFDVEAIWEHLYNRIKDYGTTGMAISAFSGIDIALWDIMGRAVHRRRSNRHAGAYPGRADGPDPVVQRRVGEAPMSQRSRALA
jgi:hypothetical protein